MDDMNGKEFSDLCELLPEDVHWGDLLTPQIAADIALAGVAVERERYAPLMQSVEWLLEDGHMDTGHLARLRSAFAAATSEPGADRQEELSTSRGGKQERSN